MNNDIKLIVTGISQIKDDTHTKVYLDRNLFNAVTGASPKLPFVTVPSADGKIRRIFQIDGKELVTIYSRETGTAFAMKHEDAEAYLQQTENSPLSSELEAKIFEKDTAITRAIA
jgi:hypothetical protein